MSIVFFPMMNGGHSRKALNKSQKRMITSMMAIGRKL